MQDPAEDRSLLRGHIIKDKKVLKYLREMIRRCKDSRRRDMVSYYEAARDFAAEIIYGPLPPRQQDLSSTFYKPENPSVPAGFRPPVSQQPLRKIVKLNEHPHGYSSLKWEFLECGHELLAPVGHHSTPKRRRCIYCAAQKAFAKKLPAGVPIVKTKAVSA